MLVFLLHLIGNVILLTADEGVREAAKRHNLPAELWKDLDSQLFHALNVHIPCLRLFVSLFSIPPTIHKERSKCALDCLSDQGMHAWMHGEA